MSGSSNYSRLNSDEENTTKIQNDIELATAPAFIVTILNKEKSYDISGVTASTKLSQFKIWVASSTGVEIPQQRLIYAGRRLDNDDKMLREFKITSACRVHLFPIPIANLVASISSTSAATVNATPFNQSTNGSTPVFNPMFPNANRMHGDNDYFAAGSLNAVNHTPMHFDDYVIQSSREVKIWSLILIFLSFMTILDVFSALFTASSTLFGTRILHTVVIFLNTVCSIAGLYVGQLGLQSARSLILEDITKYLKFLRFLALATISMRILWVFDVVQDVQKIVDDSQTAGGSGSGSSGSTSGAGTNAIPLDQNVVQSYTIQATLVCFVCAYAWTSCLVRAIRLHELVAQYSQENLITTSATATTAASVTTVTAVANTGPGTNPTTITTTATANMV